MARDTVTIGVQVDRETDLELRKWCRAENRSKRRQAAVGLRRLAQLRQHSAETLLKMPAIDVLRRLELVP